MDGRDWRDNMRSFFLKGEGRSQQSVCSQCARSEVREERCMKSTLSSHTSPTKKETQRPVGVWIQKLKHIHSGDKAKSNTAVRCGSEKTNGFSTVSNRFDDFCEWCPIGRAQRTTAQHREYAPSAPTPIHTPPTPTPPEHTNARATPGRPPINIEIIHDASARIFRNRGPSGEPAIHTATRFQNSVKQGGDATCGNHCFHTIRRATARWSPSCAVLDRKITYVANSHFRSALQHTSWCSQAGTGCLNNTLAPACARHHAKKTDEAKQEHVASVPSMHAKTKSTFSANPCRPINATRCTLNAQIHKGPHTFKPIVNFLQIHMDPSVHSAD